MVVMRLDYQTLIAAIHDEIANGGADLSQDMSKTVQQVRYGDPRHITVPIIQYPSVFVQLMGKEEEWAMIGSIGTGDSGDKYATVTVNVYGFVQSTDRAQDTADKDIRALASNIEGLIRNDVRLGNITGLMWITPTTTNFVDEWRDGVHVKAVTITFVCRYLVNQV